MASQHKDATECSKKSKLENEEQRSGEPEENEPLPRYYNSEPSGQPPHYHKATGTAQYAKRKSNQPEPQVAGASAASVAAMLAPPSTEKYEKRTWRERWKELKAGLIQPNEGSRDDLYRPDVGSTAHWNVFGSRIDGGITMKRNFKR